MRNKAEGSWWTCGQSPRAPIISRKDGRGCWLCVDLSEYLFVICA